MTQNQGERSLERLEEMLLVLADYGQYLYRTDEGWVVNDDYNPNATLHSGRPSSTHHSTVYEAAEAAVQDMIDRLTQSAVGAEASYKDARTQRDRFLKAAGL